MRQSTVIFGTLLFAFIVYITLRGQLPAYFDLFKPGAKSSPAASSGVAPVASSGGGGGNLLGDGPGAMLDKAKGLLKGLGF